MKPYRLEKGAAVADAEFLQANCPDRADFSPHNMRRIFDFYRMYQSRKPNCWEDLLQAYRGIQVKIDFFLKKE